MSGYLLDTHVLLWWLSDPERLSASARDVIGPGRNDVVFSAAAGWEMAIKKTLGRLEFPTNLDEVLRQERISVLQISLEHALAVADLPLHHHDPFDRMQIAQAKVEDLILVTRDAQIAEYGIETLEA